MKAATAPSLPTKVPSAPKFGKRVCRRSKRMEVGEKGTEGYPQRRVSKGDGESETRGGGGGEDRTQVEKRRRRGGATGTLVASPLASFLTRPPPPPVPGIPAPSAPPTLLPKTTASRTETPPTDNTDSRFNGSCMAQSDREPPSHRGSRASGARYVRLLETGTRTLSAELLRLALFAAAKSPSAPMIREQILSSPGLTRRGSATSRVRS